MLNTQLFNWPGLQNDLRASVVVFLVALPLCLGISLASGAPLLAGVVAGIIGGLVVGAISNSSTSVSGPAAGLTVIVLNAINVLGDFYSFTLAVFIAGLIQIVLGMVKAGKAGAYFPNSVIKGMLAAIGLILILKQVPHAVGFDKDFMGDDSFTQMDGENTFSEILKAFGAFHGGAIIISLLSLFSMVYWEKLAKRGVAFFKIIPGPLFAVLFGVALNELVFTHIEILRLEKEHLVLLPLQGGFGSFFESLQWPKWSGFSNFEVYRVALTLAIVASLETLLSIEAVDKLDPHKRHTDKNRELIAQGLGNTVAGLVGALPVTSVIVRSSANVGSDVNSKISTILHGLWLLLAIVLIPFYLELIPLASLAAVLLIVGYKLCNPSLFKQMAKIGKQQLIPFIVTILAILFTDLLVGIFIGIITGFVFVLKSHAQNTIVVVNEGKNYLVRFMKDASFLQKPKMAQILSSIPNGSNVVIDGSNHFHIDNDIIVQIEEFLEVCEERNIQCEIIKSTIAINKFLRSRSMEKIKRLLLENKAWAQGHAQMDPKYFENMAEGQNPEILWIGCADSRVPPDEIINTKPGSLFVHRNVANIIYSNDDNILSVIEYAVLYLGVKYIIVCGHYHCGGVAAAFGGIDNPRLASWIKSVSDVKTNKKPANVEELVEQNVCAQLENLKGLEVLQKVWRDQPYPKLIGWVYDIGSGLIKQLASFDPADKSSS